MFYLLGREPRAKEVYLKEDENFRYQYIVTKTREILNVFENNESGRVECSIYITKKRINDVDGFTVQTYGSAEKFEHLLHLKHHDFITQREIEHTLDSLGFTLDKNSKIKANKLKEPVKYTEMRRALSNLDLSNYNTIEEFLYENVPFEEIIDEMGVDLSWTEEKDYRILTSKEDIEEFIEGLAKTENVVGFDTETTGLNVGRGKVDFIVGLSMSYEDDTGYYFPLNQKRFENVEMGTEKFLEMLKPYIDSNSPTAKPLVTHNGGFDWKVLRQFDIDLNIVHDTFIRVALLDNRTSKRTFRLKDAVSDYLGIDVLDLPLMYRDKSKEEIGAIKRTVFREGIPIDEVTKYKLERIDFFKGKGATLPYDFRYASREFAELYGSADADYPRIMYHMQEEMWDNDLDTVYRIEMEAIKPIGEQEYWGIKTDREALEKLNEQAKESLTKIEEEIYELVGEEFNISSPIQLARILFDKLGYEYHPRFNTKTGGRGTNKNVLKYLSRQRNTDGSSKYPVADLLLEHSRISQLISSFYGKLPSLIHYGILYPSYKQLGTDTGRLSAEKPNIQQMEPSVRYHMHVDDTEEYYMMICDYSQVEYRVMGGLSGEPKVVNFFKTNPEADYHIQAYSNMHNIPYEDVTSEQRSEGKTLNFGTTYGLEDENLANNLYGNTSPIHQHRAREARKKYFDGIPVLRDYFEAVRDQAERDGYVKTLFGRKRYIVEFLGKDVSTLSEYSRAKGRRIAGNTRVQGTSADIQKLAMYRIRKILNDYGIPEEDIHLILNVHDEIAIHVSKKYHPYFVLKVMRQAMEMDLSKYGLPPLYIGANIGTNWGAGQDDDMEMPVMLMEEVMEKVEKENIKYTDDDVSVQDLIVQWKTAIEKFAIRQIEFEIIDRKLTDIDEIMEVGRIIKYSKYFEHPKYMIYMVYNAVINKVGTVENIQQNYKELLKDGDSYEYVPKKVKVSEEDKKFYKGREIPSTNNLKENLLKYIHIGKTHELDETKTITITCVDSDTKFLTFIENMLVDYSVYRSGVFKDNQQYLDVRIKIDENSDYYYFNQRGILSGMVKLIPKYLLVHLYGIGDYSKTELDIERLGSSLIKQ